MSNNNYCILGESMAEKRKELMSNYDYIRQTLLQEPRGYPCQNLNFIFPSKFKGRIISKTCTVNPKKGGLFWQLRRQGVICPRRETMVIEAVNFHPTSTIRISYESCDLQASFGTLVRSLKWPKAMS